MDGTRFRRRVMGFLREITLDAGRALLLVGILVKAFVASVLTAATLFGLTVVTGGAGSALIAVRAGSEAATHVVSSFSDRQMTFYVLSMWSALGMGVAAHWLYQQAITWLWDPRMWLKTSSHSR